MLRRNWLYVTGGVFLVCVSTMCNYLLIQNESIIRYQSMVWNTFFSNRTGIRLDFSFFGAQQNINSTKLGNFTDNRTGVSKNISDEDKLHENVSLHFDNKLNSKQQKNISVNEFTASSNAIKGTFDNRISSQNFSRMDVGFLKIPSPGCFETYQALILVKSSVSHFELRNAIRATWASLSKTNTSSIRVIFLLGQPQESKEYANKLVVNEHSKYDDIIQGEFLDTYDNLTLKTLMGMRWVTIYCRNVSLVLSVDDDTYVDLIRLEKFARSLIDSELNEKVLRCGLLLYPHPDVRRTGKWAVPREVYNFTFYPKYCAGGCYIMSRDVAENIYSASLNSSLALKIDDVLITGVLREKVGIDLDKVEKDICFYFDNRNTDLRERIYAKFKETSQMINETVLPTVSSTTKLLTS